MSPLLIDRHLRRGKVGIGETPYSYSNHFRQSFGQVEINIASAGRTEMKDKVVSAISLAIVYVGWSFNFRLGFRKPSIQVVTRSSSSLAKLTVTHEGQFRLAPDLYGNGTAVTLGCSVHVLAPRFVSIRSFRSETFGLGSDDRAEILGSSS